MNAPDELSVDPSADVSAEVSVVQKLRQGRLFEMQSCLSIKLGADVFRSLPSTPGVYFFYDQQDQLLYIGQSGNLKARVGSYRHVSVARHSIRLRRMVSRVARLEWRECATAIEAIELERTLLLECRPPFNRAGVWVGELWYFKIQTVLNEKDELTALSIELSRNPHMLDFQHVYGPLPSGFRYLHGSLVRCLFKHLNPEAALWQYPLGLLNHTVPLQMRLVPGKISFDASIIQQFFYNQDTLDDAVSWLDELIEKTSTGEKEYWANEVDGLKKYMLSKKRSILTHSESHANQPEQLLI